MSATDRLAEIRQKMERANVEALSYNWVTVGDVKFLLSLLAAAQAEHAAAQESATFWHADAMIHETEIEDLQQQLAGVKRERERLEGENRSLRTALAQYANPQSWDTVRFESRAPDELYYYWRNGDRGYDVAQEALKEPTP